MGTLKTLRRIATKKLPILFDLYEGRCFYCSMPVVMVRTVPLERQIRNTGNFLRWRDEQGREWCDAIATADHVVDLQHGGSSAIENLVLACALCNNRRSVLNNRKYKKYIPKTPDNANARRIQGTIWKQVPDGRMVRCQIPVRLGFYAMPYLLGLVPGRDLKAYHQGRIDDR
jgi:hypothetical protein